MPSLKGTRTEENLNDSYAGESRAYRRYLGLARKADVEGLKDLAAALRSIARGRTAHAHGHLDYLDDLAEAGDPATGKAPGPAGDVPREAIASETHDYIDMYAGMVRVARQEGADELADWFETLARAGRSHAGRIRKALDAL